MRLMWIFLRLMRKQGRHHISNNSLLPDHMTIMLFRCPEYMTNLPLTIHPYRTSIIGATCSIWKGDNHLKIKCRWKSWNPCRIWTGKRNSQLISRHRGIIFQTRLETSGPSTIANETYTIKNLIKIVRVVLLQVFLYRSRRLIQIDKARKG